MRIKRKIILLIMMFFALTFSCMGQNKIEKNNEAFSLSNLKTGFITPPDSMQTSVYWYWISDNISKEGVIKDLQSMKKVGINRAFIGNIGLDETPYGKVKIFTNEWWDVIHAALKTATELNIEIGIFNSPGWSQSGGPWIKPSQSMRYLTSSEVEVKGAKKIDIKLEVPAKDFQDVSVIAFPKPKDYDKKMVDLHPEITSSPAIQNIEYCMDGDSSTEITVPSGLQLNFKTQQPFTARSITFYPSHRVMKIEGEIQAGQNGNYETIKKFVIDRSNAELNVGFLPFAPAAISFPSTTSKNFRIVFTNVSPNAGFREINISSSPKVEDYAEKTLAKMFPTPFPYWNAYQWPVQSQVKDKSMVINPKEVLDVSKYMNADGQFLWNAPPGEWIIMRTGMIPTRVVNSPASPEGRGLEVDKMSKQHVAEHFNAFLGKIMERIPPQDRKTWKVTVEDSYETGGQNWTDGMIEKFKKDYGYDPTPFIPVMFGNVVGGENMSDRFLWDLRRFVADNVAYQYVAGLREVSHKHGLHTWLENYGHWGFPGEFLQYGGQSDEVAGEFWSEGDLGNIENRAASSAAHIYGKTKVSSESFTAGGKAFARYPAIMKQRGDRFFTEGINNTLLHVYIEQAYDDKIPGVNAGFGNEFNRHNTWFSDLDLFITYLKRCNLALQQGKYVADVAYFISEDAPKMTGVRDPELPRGYSYDYINGEVIEKRLTVKDGRLTLPDGMNYGILVLPKLKTMRPELLKEIMELVKKGAVILGPKPERSPSLQNYPGADEEVKRLAAKLWGNINGENIKTNRFGKGLVIDGMAMQQALDFIHIIPDYKTTEMDSTLFIHRRLPGAEIYFISNQTEKPISINPEFRVAGKSPELWDAVTGIIRDLPEYTIKGNVTSVSLKLDALQSDFIVFKDKAKVFSSNKNSKNFPNPISTKNIPGPWTVTFDASMRGPKDPVIFNELTDWSQSKNDSIKYYSGTAIYNNTFNLPEAKKGEHTFIDLGNLIAMAKIKVNGIYVGGVWTNPYSVDITNALKPGENKLEISVVNDWMNRLIGDLRLPPEQRKTWVSLNPYNADSPLQTSGLLGPVVLKIIQY
ncbi:MAG: glycoside hydrolase family 2 [Bacteroidota bacterium]|nr:glycoside hydrolase family 2 [Bacteroidota bacterium]